MGLGLGRLKLAPATFWSLSLREWRALVEGHFGTTAPAMTRADLNILMKAYPDDGSREQLAGLGRAGAE